MRTYSDYCRPAGFTLDYVFLVPDFGSEFPPHTRPWRFSVRAALLAVREGTRPCAVSPGELEADAAPNYPTPLPEAGAPRVGEFSAHRRD